MDNQHSDGLKALVDLHVFVRTVTHAYTGKLTQVTDHDLTLRRAAWIAESGRWHLAIQGKWDEHAEIEPYPDDVPVTISRGAIVETTLFDADLPREPR